MFAALMTAWPAPAALAAEGAATTGERLALAAFAPAALADPAPQGSHSDVDRSHWDAAAVPL